ncbi:MAG TPA: CBS domain-containing protein [Bacilli bacterium]
MKIKELMTKKVITVSKDTKLSEVAKIYEKYDIGFVVAINSERDVLGVLTDRDIVIRGMARGLTGEASVEEVMTPVVIDIHRDENASRALEIMGEYQIRRLVVVNDEKKLCGVVSLADLARVKYTNKLVNETLYEISIPNPQTEKPMKYLEVDDFPL